MPGLESSAAAVPSVVVPLDLPDQCQVALTDQELVSIPLEVEVPALTPEYTEVTFLSYS